MTFTILLVFLVSFVSLNLLLLSFKSFKLAIIINLFLGLLFTRPNILGEAFGYIEPMFWIFVYYFSRKLKTELNQNRSISNEIEKLRKGILTPILFFFFGYWAYTLLIDSLRGNQISIWVVFSNFIGLFSGLAAVNSLILNIEYSLLLKVYTWFIVIPSFGGVMKYLLPEITPCIDVNLSNQGGRPFTYSVCSNGAVYLGNRFTGFGGEPAIFATEMALCIFVLLNIPIFSKITTWILITIVSAGIILTFATTGYVALAIALIYSLLNLMAKRLRIISSTLLLLGLFPFYKLLQVLFQRKIEANPLSISDRFAYDSFFDYVHVWSHNFFGMQTSRTVSGAGINLLTLSLQYGVPIILLTIFFLIRIYLAVRHVIPWNGALSIILFTMAFSQPPITNYLWLILLYLILGSQVQYKVATRISK
jgi:hypothetical protein